MNYIVVSLVIIFVLISANATNAVFYHDNVEAIASKNELEQRDKRQANFGITVTLVTTTTTTDLTKNVTVNPTCTFTSKGYVVCPNTEKPKGCVIASDTTNYRSPPMQQHRRPRKHNRANRLHVTAVPIVAHTDTGSDQMVGQALLPSYGEDQSFLTRGRLFGNLGTTILTSTNTVTRIITGTQTVSLILGGVCMPIVEEGKSCTKTEAKLPDSDQRKKRRRRPNLRGRRPSYRNKSKRRPVLRGRLPPKTFH